MRCLLCWLARNSAHYYLYPHKFLQEHYVDPDFDFLLVLALPTKSESNEDDDVSRVLPQEDQWGNEEREEEKDLD